MQAANGSVVEGKDSVSFFSSFVGTGGESMDAPQGVASPSASHNHQHSLSTATITVILPATPSKTSSPIAMAMESEQQQQLNPSPNHEHVENEDEPEDTDGPPPQPLKKMFSRPVPDVPPPRAFVRVVTAVLRDNKSQNDIPVPNAQPKPNHQEEPIPETEQIGNGERQHVYPFETEGGIPNGSEGEGRDVEGQFQLQEDGDPDRLRDLRHHRRMSHRRKTRIVGTIGCLILVAAVVGFFSISCTAMKGGWCMKNDDPTQTSINGPGPGGRIIIGNSSLSSSGGGVNSGGVNSISSSSASNTLTGGSISSGSGSISSSSGSTGLNENNNINNRIVDILATLKTVTWPWNVSCSSSPEPNQPFGSCERCRFPTYTYGSFTADPVQSRVSINSSSFFYLSGSLYLDGPSGDYGILFSKEKSGDPSGQFAVTVNPDRKLQLRGLCYAGVQRVSPLFANYATSIPVEWSNGCNDKSGSWIDNYAFPLTSCIPLPLHAWTVVQFLMIEQTGYLFFNGTLQANVTCAHDLPPSSYINGNPYDFQLGSRLSDSNGHTNFFWGDLLNFTTMNC